mmetsp:Transcript_26784/g.66652  ORF Transcript_26784/g.66652 Transcript_26784/m.66652 type:complete len:280 (-) Transcript_26784:739-1578(-)
MVLSWPPGPSLRLAGRMDSDGGGVASSGICASPPMDTALPAGGICSSAVSSSVKSISSSVSSAADCFSCPFWASSSDLGAIGAGGGGRPPSAASSPCASATGSSMVWSSLACSISACLPSSSSLFASSLCRFFLCWRLSFGLMVSSSSSSAATCACKSGSTSLVRSLLSFFSFCAFFLFSRGGGPLFSLSPSSPPSASPSSAPILIATSSSSSSLSKIDPSGPIWSAVMNVASRSSSSEMVGAVPVRRLLNGPPPPCATGPSLPLARAKSPNTVSLSGL